MNYLAQPRLSNWGWVQPYIEQYRNGAGQILTRYWYDESKKQAESAARTGGEQQWSSESRRRTRT
jgi:hypothetical protein